VSLPPSPAPAAQREQGILEIRIKDHREAIDDFARLNVVIEGLLISPKPGLGLWPSGWKDLGGRGEAIDLTKYVGGKTARAFRGPIDARSFDAFHLKLKSIEAILKKTQRRAPVKDTVSAVQAAFDVPSGGETILIIDLVVTDFSDHPPRGYELGVRGYQVYTNGKLKAKIPPG
jgi:hypothetical protein